MSAIRRVAILLHERQRDALSWPYRVWAMGRQWERVGIRVDPVWGIERPIKADLLIAHIDLSYIPDDYWEFMQKFPGPVVNRRVRDIRKRVFSEVLVRPGDGYEGPVIVKTNLNSGGRPERKILGEGAPETLMERLLGSVRRRAWVERRRLVGARSLRRYHLFASAGDVPPAVFENPALVVERFVPEIQDGLYLLRTYTFFGDREQGRHFAAAASFIRARPASQPREDSWDRVPTDIIKWRKRLGLDYAKMDFVIHEGQPILLDVNTTPGMRGEVDETRVHQSRHLSRGLKWFENEGAGR